MIKSRQQVISEATERGWQLQYATAIGYPYGNDILVFHSARTPGPNHVVHALLTLLTLGLWIFVWLFVAAFAQGGQYQILTVDRFGDSDWVYTVRNAR